jgi:transmembrane sensor
MTSKFDPSDVSDDPASAARRWVVRLRSGATDQADIDAWERWRREHPDHRKAFALANAQWSMLRQAAANVAAGEAERKVVADNGSARLLSRRSWMVGAMAASFGGAAYLAARPPLELWPSLSELNADFRTGIGERRQIAFADKVSVEMNTRTSLAVPSGGTGGRQVDLVGGEIAVSTGIDAPPPSDPFIVVAGNGRASATRATFDLRREGHDVSVTCLDGEVSIECRGATARLTARQRITWGANGLGDPAPIDGRAIDAWRQGLLVFDNRPLAQVIPEINRYRRGRVVLTNEKIGLLPLDATFRLDRIDDAVPKIAHLFGLKIRTLPGGLVFLS